MTRFTPSRSSTELGVFASGSGMSSKADTGVSAHLTSILCWTFLPSVFTNLVLSTFYRVSPRSKPTLPPHASRAQVADANATAQRHFRHARIALVVAYLAYSILSVYASQASGSSQNYYALLGVARDAVERDGPAAVKSHWRRLARVYHPDKVGKQGEARFVELRHAVDVLEHDGKRWAYERFGPPIAEWGPKLASNREFLVKGATNAAAFWIFAFVSIAAVGFFRRDERRNNFWRYLTLALSASLEFHFVLRPSPSPTFSFVFPNRLTYEHVALLRQLFISVSVAMSQLAPLLRSPLVLEPGPSLSDTAAWDDAETLKPALSRLAQLTAAATVEATGLQHLELRPLFLPPASAAMTEDEDEDEPTETATDQGEAQRREVVERVKEHMARTFEDLQLKSDPTAGRIWEAAVKNARARRRDETDGPEPQKMSSEEKEEEEEKEKEETREDSVEVPTVGAPPEPFGSIPSPPTSPTLVSKELDAADDKSNAGENFRSDCA
ncbi:hypothetical protein JCM11491_004756 [Sporobolomyces phaffii]